MPGIRSSRPAGRAGGLVGGGGQGDVGAARRTWATQRPAPAMAAAARAAPPVAIRTVRRDADVVVGSAWSPAWSPSVRAAMASDGPTSGAGAGSANRYRPARVRAPTRAATALGTRSRTPALGRSRASTPAIAASPTIMVMPRASRRAATIPAMPARMSTTTSTEPIRIGLSAVPKVRIAHSLTGVGVRSMTVDPTASTGEAAGTVRAATRWAAAIPTRVARMPYRAWSSRMSTIGVRCGGPVGWVAAGWRP